ncbi:hypothetical protein ACFFSW_17885 [Saccharothrix longispora]|uniref:Uncharacterized protein n=1 Tax=Saccharothrix longispora TaxID=33920 RepID=A0ABU1PSC5_9PSEU|nr:hypothetical protein [Saccharothrix longispora]MDR6593551.1 hypothetical protein [Saccharothrix longispora]
MLGLLRIPTTPNATPFLPGDGSCAQAASMPARDFVRVGCAVTLKRVSVFFVLELATRYAHILSTTTKPDGPWKT